MVISTALGTVETLEEQGGHCASAGSHTDVLHLPTGISAAICEAKDVGQGFPACGS